MNLTSHQEWIIWKCISHAWTEYGLDDVEIKQFAIDLRSSSVTWDDIHNTIFKQCYWGYSWMGLAFFIGFIPILGWIATATLLPEAEWEDTCIQKQIENFKAWKVFYYLNPLCWVGYVLCCFIAHDFTRKLKKAYLLE